MHKNVGIVIAVVIVFGLVVALGFVVSKNSPRVGDFFNTQTTSMQGGKAIVPFSPAARTQPSQNPAPLIEGTTNTSGWTMYTDSAYLFSFQYPAKISVSSVSQKSVYPQKQYDLIVPDFMRAIAFSSREFSKRLPRAYILTFASHGQGLDAWLASHSDIKRGYSRQTPVFYNGKMFYEFSDIRPDEVYNRGELTYRTRTDIPEKMYLTASNAYVYAILFDYSGISKPYGATIESIIKTFRIY